jgi:hypothetical protein
MPVLGIGAPKVHLYAKRAQSARKKPQAPKARAKKAVKMAAKIAAVIALFCVVCGKPLKHGTCGPRCALLAKLGFTATLIATHKLLHTALTLVVPAGAATIAAVHIACNTTHACTVSSMVNATGSDGALLANWHVTTWPVFIAGTRYIPTYYTTKAGLQALYTRNASAVPGNITATWAALVAATLANKAPCACPTCRAGSAITK